MASFLLWVLGGIVLTLAIVGVLAIAWLLKNGGSAWMK